MDDEMRRLMAEAKAAFAGDDERAAEPSASTPAVDDDAHLRDLVREIVTEELAKRGL